MTAVTSGAAAGAPTAAVAKTASLVILAKWVVASVVVVSGTLATAKVVLPAKAKLNTENLHANQPPPKASPTREAAPLTPRLVATTEPSPTPVNPQPRNKVRPPQVTESESPFRELPVAAERDASPAGASQAPPSRADDLRPKRTSITEEIALLDRARRLLARGQGVASVEAIDAYQRAFPTGVLVEEATALEVEARATAGDHERARAVGDRFLELYPKSPLVPRVVRALGSGAPPLSH